MFFNLEGTKKIVFNLTSASEMLKKINKISFKNPFCEIRELSTLIHHKNKFLNKNPNQIL